MNRTLDDMNERKGLTLRERTNPDSVLFKAGGSACDLAGPWLGTGVVCIDVYSETSP